MFMLEIGSVVHNNTQEVIRCQLLFVELFLLFFTTSINVASFFNYIYLKCCLSVNFDFLF